MAAAGFIPVVGWAGRAAKGGNAVYKTVKGLNAADYALDAYKSTKAMDILKQTEPASMDYPPPTDSAKPSPARTCLATNSQKNSAKPA